MPSRSRLAPAERFPEESLSLIHMVRSSRSPPYRLRLRVFPWTGRNRESEHKGTSITITEDPHRFLCSDQLHPDCGRHSGTINALAAPIPTRVRIPVLTPAPGYSFSSWTQSSLGLPTPQGIHRCASWEPVRAYNLLSFSDLNHTAGTGGSVSNNPAGTSLVQAVSITTTPDSGYYFTGWTGNEITDLNASTTTVTISGDQASQS